jgi:hypothetical protein
MSPNRTAFPGNPSHAGYSQTIRDSVEQKEGSNPSWRAAYDILDPASNSTYPLRRGDIIVQNRLGTSINFDTDPWETAGTHGDIVVSVKPGAFPREIEVIGGNLNNAVRKRTIKFYPTLNSQFDVTVTSLPAQALSNTLDYFVVIRPKSPDYVRFAIKRAEFEYNLWKTNGWTDTDAAADAALTRYWSAAGYSYKRAVTITDSTTYSTQGGLSPYLASLQSFHPNIQYELTRRRFASETANTHMPFIKLTSLMRVKPENLNTRESAWCPSLGIHGIPEVSYEDLYSPRSKKSIIGYASSANNKRVPVVVETSQFDPENIPVPGIIEAAAERSLAGPMGVRGGLLRANLKIRAYSIGQVNALMRYYFKPSTRVVLEFGRTSSSTTEQPITTYDWKRDSSIIANEIRELIAPSPADSPENTIQKRQERFIKKYVYNNYGNYEIFIGYVAGFNMKYTKNNTFEIDLTVHSTQQFEIPSAYTGVKTLCGENAAVPCKALDVVQYFEPQYSWMENTFSSLMSKVLGATIEQDFALTSGLASSWTSDVIAISDSSMRENDGEDTRTESSGTSGNYAGTGKGGYFVSWKFFIDVILNDPDYGILSTYVFKNQEDIGVKQLLQTGLLRSTVSPSEVADDYKDPNVLVANRVGYHPWLRSTNLGTMLIYNEYAQSVSDAILPFDRVQNVATAKGITLEDSDISTKITTSRVGSFKQLGNGGAGYPGYGSLFDGIWLNTNAIIQAFTTTDTISAALNKLLADMNTATAGYWNLQLYSNDTRNPGMHVIDMSLSTKVQSSEQSLPEPDDEAIRNPQTLRTVSHYGDSQNNKPKYVYMFNRRTKQFSTDDIGNELLDLNIDYKLPLMVAIQAIAGVGGPTETATLKMGGITEIQELSLLDDLYVTCPSASATTDICNSSPEALELQKQADLQRQITELENNAPLDEYVLPEFLGGETTGDKIAELQTQLAASKAQSLILTNPQLENIIRTYAHLGAAIRFGVYNVAELMQSLYADSQSVEQGGNEPDAHAFNSSNLTKLMVDLTIPGIGGIELWQSFLVDRVPNILDRGYFVVTKVSHQFKKETGWVTMLQGMFRYKPKKESPR